MRDYPSIRELSDWELEQDLERPAVPLELRRALRAEQARRRKRREREVVGVLLFMGVCLGAALFLLLGGAT